MTAILSLLKAHKLLAALGAVILALATAVGVQTWRIGQLQQEIGSVGAQLDQAVAANESNQTTITALVTAAKSNRTRYENAIRRAGQAGARADELAEQIKDQADNDISAVEADTSDCGSRTMPDAIRVRLAPRDYRDDGSSGNRRTPDSD